MPSHSKFERSILAVKGRIGEIEARDALSPRFQYAVVIDIRAADELVDGRWPNALHIPRGLLERDIEAAIPSNGTRIFLLCADGNRSLLAAATLRSLGYPETYVIAGGWTRAAAQFPCKRSVALQELPMTATGKSRLWAEKTG